jgi:superfamily II DNA/RNA helicase
MQKGAIRLLICTDIAARGLFFYFIYLIIALLFLTCARYFIHYLYKCKQQ